MVIGLILSKSMVFNSILQYHDKNFKRHLRLSKSEFDQWVKFFSFAALSDGSNLGKKFCQDFQLTDFMLIYVLDNFQSIEHIKQHYVVD
jgi:hypothetical protein